MRPEASERKDIEIIEAPGQLPTFWNHRAVFVANLLGLFFGNEEETRRLAEEVGEVDSYGGRLIPIVDLLFGGAGSNLLVLEREPDPALCRYFEETAGLSLPEQLVLPHRDYLEIGSCLKRGEGASHAVLDRIAETTAADGYRIQTLLKEVILSEPFLGEARSAKVETAKSNR